MDQVKEAVRAKLGEGQWDYGDLPAVRDDGTSWADVQRDCKLSNSELSHLKNIRCQGTNSVHLFSHALRTVPHFFLWSHFLLFYDCL